MHISWILSVGGLAVFFAALFVGAYFALSREFSRQADKNLQFLQGTHESYQSAAAALENRIGQLQQAASQVLGLGREIASLQNILQNPKLRGGMGEFLLEELLNQILPPESYSLQYAFTDGQRVDAVLHLEGGMVTVDSKFPLDNYQKLYAAGNDIEKKTFRRHFIQDVKKHLDDIASKYIRPGEVTLDFAMAFIPAESVYYEAFLAAGEDARLLSAHALKNKVLAVSPQGFYAYLQVIARGLKGLRIEKTAHKILEQLNQFEADFLKAFADFDKLGTHLKSAQTAYERSQRHWLDLKEDLSAFSLLKEAQPSVQTASGKPTPQEASAAAS